MRGHESAAGGVMPGTGPGDETIARIRAMDAERAARAAPIYPDTGDRLLDDIEAAELAAAFRSQRDSRRGDAVAPRTALAAHPALVAAALMQDGVARMAGLDGRDLKAAQRELAEAFVDLQSFRPDEEAARILSDPTGAVDEVESLRTAQAAIIALIREDDMSVTGNMNALRGLDLRIGDGRIALDAVDRYREHQALGLLAMVGVPILLIVVAVVVVLALVIRPGF